MCSPINVYIQMFVVNIFTKSARGGDVVSSFMIFIQKMCFFKNWGPNTSRRWDRHATGIAGTSGCGPLLKVWVSRLSEWLVLSNATDTALPVWGAWLPTTITARAGGVWQTGRSYRWSLHTKTMTVAGGALAPSRDSSGSLLYIATVCASYVQSVMSSICDAVAMPLDHITICVPLPQVQRKQSWHQFAMQSLCPSIISLNVYRYCKCNVISHGINLDTISVGYLVQLDGRVADGGENAVVRIALFHIRYMRAKTTI